MNFVTFLRKECQAIFRILGNGHRENIYHKAIIRSFITNNVSFDTEVQIPIHYQNHYIGTVKPDLIVMHNDLRYAIEIKTVTKISQNNKSQLEKYLKQDSLKINEGILINFSSSGVLEIIESQKENDNEDPFSPE